MYYYSSYQPPLALILVFLLLSIVVIIAMWQLFAKAGQPGWAAIVPVYNAIILFRIAGKEWWYIFLMLIPIYNIVIIVQMWHAISTAFGKDKGFTAGLVLLGFIFIPILAFGPAQYNTKPVNANAPLDQI